MAQNLASPPRYAARVPLVACPFCREMFPVEEHSTCPVCAVPLVAVQKLAVSDEALSEDGIAREPAWEPLGPLYFGRSRGPLVVLGVLGLVAFFLPWVHLTMPDVVSLSGFDLARRLGWSWGAGVAWFVLVPTVVTRRSVMKMRGARVAASFLAAIPGVTAAILLARPPHGAHGVPVHFSWGIGLAATVVFSAAAVGFALFFGGRVDDLSLRRGTSAGQVVH
ncbi:MAG TPA: hypothetical protein VGG39_21450 [Polyangiaceae bacterium]|jgi:hypothetical protein